ncbi:MAG: protein kinase domain-containing protein, partial [Solirubrobacteraceae bacterium]
MSRDVGGATLLRGRYQPLAVLGAGGEGRLLKALDHQHGRLVALKIRPIAPGAPIADILREPRVLLTLPAHPALPLVRDDFFEGDEHVTVMDWVDGTNLQHVLEANGSPGLPITSVLAQLAEAGEALTYLHTHDPQVIHRDVKPA